jgi:hypothetical protein
MDFALAGMFSLEDVYALDYALERIRSDSPMIEIGSFAGRSTCFLLHLLKKRGLNNRLIGVDPWLFENADSSGDLRLDAYRSYVIHLYESSVRFWHPDRRAAHVALESDLFFEAWEAGRQCETTSGEAVKLGGPISFALVDGAHNAEQVRRDMQNVTAILERGGFVYMHDTAGDEFGCRQVMREVLRKQPYQLVMENPNALLRKTA